MKERTEQQITEMAHSATAGWCCTNPQRMAAAIRGYKLGYKQAEKDLALTWGDVQLINTFILELAREEESGVDWGDSEKYYGEALRRFRETKNK